VIQLRDPKGKVRENVKSGEHSTAVMIVGAGPVGLTLAILLVRWDISFYLIEKNPDISKESNAFNLQARTLKIFDQLGIAEDAINQGEIDNTSKNSEIG